MSHLNRIKIRSIHLKKQLFDSNDNLKLLTPNSYTPTSIIFSSHNSKKVKLIIPDLNQIKKNEENSPNFKNKSAISSPKKHINLSPILPEKSLAYQKKNLINKSPNEKMLKTGDLMAKNVSSNPKNLNSSFLKSNSLSPKKNFNLITKSFCNLNHLDFQEKEFIHINGVIKGGK